MTELNLLGSAVHLLPPSPPSVLDPLLSRQHVIAPSPAFAPQGKAGTAACPRLDEELGDSQGTYLGGAESQHERLLGSKVLLSNTLHVVTLATFQMALGPFTL